MITLAHYWPGIWAKNGGFLPFSRKLLMQWSVAGKATNIDPEKSTMVCRKNLTIAPLYQ